MSQQLKISDNTHNRLKKMSEVLHWSMGYCVAYLLDIYEGMDLKPEPPAEAVPLVEITEVGK